MKKKYVIVGLVVLFISSILIFIYSQMKVDNIIIDIDYAKSSYFTTIMEPNKDDIILITLNSKIKITNYIKETKLFNKNVEFVSSDDSIAYVEGDNLIIKNLGTVDIYCKSILGTKSNKIRFSVVQEEE